MNIILAQIIGFIAILCTIASVQQNKKKNVLIFQIVANALYFIQYILLSAFSGAVVAIVGVVRSCIFYKYDKEGKEKSLIVLIILLGLIVILGMLSYDNLFSLVPIIGSILYTYGTWQNDLKKFRRISLIVPVFWFGYNLYVNAYVGVVSSVLEFISAVIAIIRLDVMKKKE